MSNKKYLAVSVISLVAFAVLLILVRKDIFPVLYVDGIVSQNIYSVRTPFLTVVMVFFSFIGVFWFIAILGLIIGIFLFFKKQYVKAILLALVITGAGFFTDIFKDLIARIRPGNLSEEFHTYAFPSGHTVMATAFGVVLSYIFARHIEGKNFRIIFLAVNALLAFAIGLSRIYLNVHWVSDVFAGFAFGLFWSFFSIYLTRVFSSSKMAGK